MAQAKADTSVDGFDEAGLDLDASEIFPALLPATSEATAETEPSLAEMCRDFDGGSGMPAETGYGTRFALGIAFLEVSLVDEAIDELILAAADESRVAQCSTLIGLCYLEKGMPEAAVRWFDKGRAALAALGGGHG